MNADDFRHFYEYHFAENRKLWETHIVPLAEEKFTQHIDYSMGSVKNQLVHLMSCDEYWFRGLRGLEMPEPHDPDEFPNRKDLRAYWDHLEQEMRDYLGGLRDDMLSQKPFPGGGDDVLLRWQVLIHVINHGTDHRAQVLRILHDMGSDTRAQDYIFYVYDTPLPD